MEQAATIGIDLAKRSFQLHGAGPEESVAFRKRLSGAPPRIATENNTTED